MIIDLEAAKSVEALTSCDVCIIGAGAAGTFLASKLTKAQLTVVVLEAGGLETSKVRRPRSEPLCRRRNYAGIRGGRTFGFGGTTSLWGGQLIQLTPGDFDQRNVVGACSWPVSKKILMPYYDDVDDALGLSKKSINKWGLLNKRRVALENFDIRVSRWIPFRKRNFANAFGKKIKKSNSVTLYVNANVSSYDVDTSNEGAPRLESVTAFNASKTKQVKVNSRYFIICAGALESTRLILEIDEILNGKIKQSGAPLGQYFSDHLSINCGQVEVHDHSAFLKLIAPRFIDGVMLTSRFELSESTQQSIPMVSGFVQFVFQTPRLTGVDLVRSVVTFLQTGRFDFACSLSELGAMFWDLVNIFFWRVWHKRLWIPRDSVFSVQVDVEQVLNEKNQIYFDCERGEEESRLVVDWEISSSDWTNINYIARQFMQAFNHSEASAAAKVKHIVVDNSEQHASAYDVYHPTGALRMGDNPVDSVVDENLKVWQLDNCFVSSTLVFPSAGSANPGYTHLALTSRLSEHLQTLCLQSDQ